MSEFNGKKILVLGMARSGIAAAKLLLREGAEVTISDLKSGEAFGDDLNEILKAGCRDELGREVSCELLKKQDLLVISPGVPIDAAPVKLAEENGIPVIGELEMACRLVKGPMVAVTGTNGKTTTVTLLGEMFKAAGNEVYVCGNIGYPVSAAVLEAGDNAVIVAEVSSFQLESIERFHPLSAAVLNITEDHLNRHKTMKRYTELKKRVFENQNENDIALINMDDPLSEGLTEGLKAHTVYFSRKKEPEQGAFVRNGRIMLRLNGAENDICAAEDVYIPGPHNLENALAASLIAYSRGVQPEVIAEVLKTFRGVEHRIEFVRELDGVRYINDSKGTNTDSTVKAVASMTRPTVLILGGSDKHVPFDTMAEYILSSGMITHCVMMGQTGPQIRAALLKAGFTALTDANDMKDAVEKSRALAVNGGNVLLSPACASFDMFTGFEQRGEVFKQIVNGLE